MYQNSNGRCNSEGEESVYSNIHGVSICHFGYSDGDFLTIQCAPQRKQV